MLFLDSAPIIYVLEGHRRFASRFLPIFERHAAGALRFAISTITIAEVLTGPLRVGDDAESAARLRTTAGLRLPDAVQVASAIAVGADALLTHDRDFAKVRAIPIFF
jgi:predicted nucleic acid-binding protein